MQNFYKVTQGNNDKVPSFATRLEGTLNQIRLQCPSRMTDFEVQHHLKDHLFHGVHKHIYDSTWYLYSTPGTSYLQLMVAAHKAESENEEIWDKVRARAAVVTDSGEGMAELGQQIAKLMATLTKVGQGNSPSNMPSIPGCGVMEGDTMVVAPPNFHNGTSGPGQTIPAHSSSRRHGVGGPRNWSNGQGNQGTSMRREATANRWDPNSLQSFMCQGGATWLGNALLQWQLLTSLGAPHIPTLTLDRGQPAWRQPNKQAREKPPQSSHFWIQTPLPTWLDNPMRPL